MSDLDLALSELPNRDALSDLAGMLLIRHAELLLAEEAEKKTFGTPIHLAIGQEAVAVGISKWLRKSDSIFGNHRSHAHFLSTGAPLKSLFSEILGRSTGASGGKGGSMHLKFPKTGLMGTMPIVAGTIPIAVGAALTKRKPSNSDIAVIYFGDGAAEEGVFHESLNLARILNLPILFVCENNIYSSHLHIEERQPRNDISRFAKAHDIKSFTVDGNKVNKVTQVANSAISYCRDMRQPVMIEAHTYRLYGHVGFQKDQNVGLYRDKELPEWEKKDPIAIESGDGVTEKRFSENDINELKTIIKDYVALTWQNSLKDLYPVDSQLTANVYYKELK